MISWDRGRLLPSRVVTAARSLLFKSWKFSLSAWHGRDSMTKGQQSAGPAQQRPGSGLRCLRSQSRSWRAIGRLLITINMPSSQEITYKMWECNNVKLSSAIFGIIKYRRSVRYEILMRDIGKGWVDVGIQSMHGLLNYCNVIIYITWDINR